jgi:Transglutaminase-like superfamily
MATYIAVMMVLCRLAAFTCLLVACDRTSLQEESRSLFVTAPTVSHRANLEEVRRSRGAGGWQLQRVWHDPLEPDNKQKNALENAIVDERGQLLQASYRNETAFGRRYVELKTDDQGNLILESRGDGERMTVPTTAPAVLATALHLVTFKGPAVVIDLATAQAVWVPQLERVPLRSQASEAPAPIAMTMGMSLQPPTAPTPIDPVRDGHRLAAPLLEVDSDKVKAFAKQTAPSLSPLAAAEALREGMRSRIGADRAGPPSALNTVTFGGDEDGAACLMVAALRVLGHPARLVAGIDIATRHGQSWAEVHDGVRWQPVLATPSERMSLAEGLYSPVLLALLSPGPGL